MVTNLVKGKKVTVLGAARSGIAVAALLQEQGAVVFVSDSGSSEKLTFQVLSLKALGLSYETGGHTERVLDADLLVLSPGVPSNVAMVKEAHRRDVRVVSELEVASWFCPAPMVAVTGTNGKTTTTTLLGRMLHDGQVRHAVAGNIGTAFSSVVRDLTAGSVAVLEVSSFQLDDIEMFHPKVSVLLNITPDHLDRYDHLFEKYMAAKCRVFENQTLSDYLIYNYDDGETRECVRRLASLHVRALPFGIDQQFEEGAFVEEGKLVTVIDGKRSEIIEVGQISIRGNHNLYNSMAATLAAQLLNVAVPSIRATLKNFKGVEHRLEFVREVRGVKYVNDSKATNVDSVWYAVQSFDEPLVLLLGGRDKGNDYSKIHELVQQRVKAIVAIGESADTIVKEFSSLCKVEKAGSMEEAVRMASACAVSGETVLLSPACASFDWYDDFEHRGDSFKSIVNAL